MNFVKQYPESKDILEQCFIEVIHSRKWRVSIDVLEFCMHELRWPKVKEVIENIVRNTQDIRQRQALYHIPEAYSDDWDGFEYYNYYSKQ